MEEVGMDEAMDDRLVDEAWRILCNVSEGDWEKQTPEWQEAVKRFRDKYHADLDSRRR